MSYYQEISHGYRFGRVYDHLVNERMPVELRPLVDYLMAERGMRLDGIYLENYKAPDTVVVMDGALPMEDLKARFPESTDLRYTDTAVYCDKSFSTLTGK